MSTADSGLRRVAVYTDTVHTDLTLPAGVPVAALIPAIVDLLPRRAGLPALGHYRLGVPGRTPLDGAKSLTQHGIRDGTVLVLTRAENTVTEPRFDDPAEQVASTVRTAARPWTPVARRLTATLTASGLAGVAGFVSVPGGPGAPNAWLAVAAAGTVAVSAVPSSGCSGVVRVTLCCLAGVAVLAAVVGMACAATGISLQAVGAAVAAAAVALARVAGRAAAIVTGLSRRPAGAKAAHDLLTGLVAGASAAAVSGAVGVAIGAPGAEAPPVVGVAFTAAAGAALILRARSHTDALQIAALIAGGAAVIGIAVLTSAARVQMQQPWHAAWAAGLAAFTVVFGFVGPTRSPLAVRGAEVLEGLVLGTLVPLACWLCGVYGAARGLSLG